MAGSAADAPPTDAPLAGWIAPVQTCAPLAREAPGAMAAVDETSAGADAAPDTAPEATAAASLLADGALAAAAPGVAGPA